MKQFLLKLLELYRPLPEDYELYFPQDSSFWKRTIKLGIQFVFLFLFNFYAIAFWVMVGAMICRASWLLGILFLLFFCLLNISMLYYIAGFMLTKVTPLPAVLACRYPLLHKPYRYIVGGWWLIHFLLGGVLAFLPRHFNDPSSFHDYTIVAAMVFSFSWAANGFLLTSVSCFGARTKTIATIWRYRYVCDLINTLISTTIFYIGQTFYGS